MPKEFVLTLRARSARPSADKARTFELHLERRVGNLE
jgi:hypothetical protein